MRTHICNCGHIIDLQEYLNAVEEEAFMLGDDADLEEEFECEVCGSRYEIEVTATISVYSDITSIECIYEAVDELNGIDVTDLMIGDSVEIPDGMYEVGSSQYLIESGVLTAIFNDLIDENQLQFQI